MRSAVAVSAAMIVAFTASPAIAAAPTFATPVLDSPAHQDSTSNPDNDEPPEPDNWADPDGAWAPSPNDYPGHDSDEDRDNPSHDGQNCPDSEQPRLHGPGRAHHRDSLNPYPPYAYLLPPSGSASGSGV
ncbi:hypothetical protein [Nocardia heshunensis]